MYKSMEESEKGEKGGNGGIEVVNLLLCCIAVQQCLKGN